MQPTNIIDPTDFDASNYTNADNNSSSVLSLEEGNKANSITLDDARTDTYQVPTPYVNQQDSTIRNGSTVLGGMSGIIHYSFGKYRLHPINTNAVGITYAPRPAVPSFGNADVRVASFNLLNYWTTFDERGADDQAEFDRQKAKIAAAIIEIDADVYGLLEIESNGTALNDLVGYLNNTIGTPTYSSVINPAYLGTDVIKSGIIYKTGKVAPLGNAMAPTDPIYERTPIAQTFKKVNGWDKFSVVMCHFRFKGCSGASGLDQDQNDGQSCFNKRRIDEANQLMGEFVDSIKSASGDSNILVMGDFNAYSQEDPIDVIESYGYARLLNDNDYSYVYQSNWGLLDHAFASNTLAPK